MHSYLRANSFGGVANAKKPPIDMHSNLAENSYAAATNAT
jgi:hypothetical protein